MDFFKKIGKEVSVFGLVFVVFIALFAYRQVTHVELSTISQDKLEEKIKDKDSFVVVVGSDSDNTTLNYKDVCLKYLEKNHGDKIYYVNLANTMNKSINSSESNKDAKDASELKINQSTLIKFSNGGIVDYVEGQDSINEYLK